MLTSEEVREIETIMDDPARRWKMSPGEAITYIEALLEDRAELQAGIERLRAALQLIIDTTVSQASAKIALGDTLLAARKTSDTKEIRQ